MCSSCLYSYMTTLMLSGILEVIQRSEMLLGPSIILSMLCCLRSFDLPRLIFYLSDDHRCCTQAITTTVLSINDKYTLLVNMQTILCIFFLYSCHSLSITYLPIISPFGIDGNTSTRMHLDLLSQTLFSPFDINVKEETFFF